MTNARHASIEGVNCLYETFAQISDPNEIKALMEDLCTAKEKDVVAQRLAVAIMLEKGESYTTIQKETGASATTIARVSKNLNSGSGGYHSVIRNSRISA